MLIVQRLLLVLALGSIPGALWLILFVGERFAHWRLSAVFPWLKASFVLAAVLWIGFWIFDYQKISNDIVIIWWGLFFILGWVRRRCKIDEHVPISLHLSDTSAQSGPPVVRP